MPLLPLSDQGAYGSFMMDWSSCPVVERDPEKVSGSWVFRDTRVPVVALFENLEGGASIDDFLLWFPGVTREQVEAVLTISEGTHDQSQHPLSQPAGRQVRLGL